MTYGYEQLSLAGHAWVLKVASYGSTGRREKERTKKQNSARVKTRADGTSFPSQVISSQNEIEIFTNVKLFTWGLPHKLIFLHELTISTLNSTMAPRRLASGRDDVRLCWGPDDARL